MSMSMSMLNQHKIWQHSSRKFFCKGCGKNFKTKKCINRSKKLACSKTCHWKNYCNFSKSGKGHEGKITVKKIILKLHVMGSEKRKRTFLALSRKRVNIFDQINHKFILNFCLTSIAFFSFLLFWSLCYICRNQYLRNAAINNH